MASKTIPELVEIVSVDDATSYIPIDNGTQTFKIKPGNLPGLPRTDIVDLDLTSSMTGFNVFEAKGYAYADRLGQWKLAFNAYVGFDSKTVDFSGSFQIDGVSLLGPQAIVGSSGYSGMIVTCMTRGYNDYDVFFNVNFNSISASVNRVFISGDVLIDGQPSFSDGTGFRISGSFSSFADSIYWSDPVPTPDDLPAGKPAGAVCLAISTMKFYKFDGSTWIAEPDNIPTSEKGIAGGVASLGLDGKVPADQLPSGGGGGPASTDELPEGVTNLYFTSSRARTSVVSNAISSGVTDQAPGQDAVFTALASKQSTSQKNQNNGYAGLDSSGKLPMALIPIALVGGPDFKGALDASTGTYPSSPSSGWYYIVSVAGTISGTSYNVGDWAIYNGTTWEKIPTAALVSSVNGQTGDVVLTTDHVAEETNLYFTDARARAAAVDDAITQGVTTRAPSQDAVYVALDGVSSALTEKQSVIEKGAANGYAGLDGTGKVPSAQLPDISGGLDSQVVSTNTTAVSNKMYFADMQTASGNLQFSLPPGTDKAVVGLTAVGASTSQSKYPFLRPASGQSINGVGVGNDLALDYDGASVTLYREDGDTEWFEARQTALAANPASASVEGVVKKNRYQTKMLTSNVTTDGSNPLSFLNLTVGRTYRIHLHVSAQRGAANGKAMLFAEHNSVVLGYAGFDDFAAVNAPEEAGEGFSVQRTFVATTTTLLIKTVLTGTNSVILGHATVPYTYATLEELNNYEETTSW